MRTYFRIESSAEHDEIFAICDRLREAIEGAARVETYGGAPSGQQTLGIVAGAGKIFPEDMVRSKVAACGLSFVGGSYHHDPVF